MEDGGEWNLQVKRDGTFMNTLSHIVCSNKRLKKNTQKTRCIFSVCKMQSQHTAVVGGDALGSHTESEANRGTREMGSYTEWGA